MDLSGKDLHQLGLLGAAVQSVIFRKANLTRIAGTDADFFILAFARELEATIVSNDRFKDRVEAFPEVRDRVIRYMIINGEVVFERRTKRRR